MVLVPAGSFTMGDPGPFCADEHEVTLTHDFYLGQSEVTNQEYLEAVQWAHDHDYVTATASSVMDNLDGSGQELLNLDYVCCEIQFDEVGKFYLRQSPTSYAESAYPSGYDPGEHPVKGVTWYGAARYCDWLSLQSRLPRAYEHGGDWLCNNHDPYGAAGYRLPTDAEWEYAAQHNDDRIYPWGNASPKGDLANYDGSVGWTLPVGSCPDGNSALGFSDLAGNVFEWCNDWHVCHLGGNAKVNPTGEQTGSVRVLRGGSWSDNGSGHDYLRCALRTSGRPSFGYYIYGFRAARTANR